MKRYAVAAVAALMLALLALPAVAAEAKIGFVDLQKALNLSDAGKAAKEKIQKTVKDYEGTVESRQKELKKLKDELEKQAMLLSESGRADKERDYQQKLKEFQRFTKDIQEELQQKDADFTRSILEGLVKVIGDIGAKGNYTIVFEKTESSVLYADDAIDMTEKVIEAYNAQYAKDKGK